MSSQEEYKKHFNSIREIIADDKLDTAFDMIEKLVLENPNMHQTLLSQKNKYTNVTRQILSGITSRDEGIRLRTDTASALLEILDKIENKLKKAKEPSLTITPDEIASNRSTIKHITKNILFYTRKNLYAIYFLAEAITLSFIFFILSFYLSQKIFHSAGDFDVRFKPKFVLLFSLISFGLYYLSIPLINIVGYNKKQFFKMPIEASIITICSIIFFWSGSWLISPVTISRVSDHTPTIVERLDSIFATEEINHVSLIESQVMNNENIDLTISAVSAFKSYQHDRALQSLFSLLDKKRNNLSNLYFYEKMIDAFVSYKEKPIGNLKKLFRAHKDSLITSIRFTNAPKIDSTLIKWVLQNSELNDFERSELLRDVQLSGDINQRIYSKIQSKIISHTEAGLLLKFIVDVFSRSTYILNDESIYSDSRNMASNNTLDAETRKRFMQIVVKYNKQSDASYFAEILRDATEDEVKIEAIRCLQILQDKKTEINKK